MNEIKRKEKHKNLLFIFADQWRRDAFGIYDSRIRTPNLDKFAEESVVFDRAYSSCPLCSPHRGCLLTGKQPIATNVFTNCKPDVEACLREDDICVSDIETGGISYRIYREMASGSAGWKRVMGCLYASWKKDAWV